MKHLRLTILTVGLLAAMSLSAAPTDLASVDINKILNGYWKTKQASAALENHLSVVRKELKDVAEDIDKAKTDYKQMLDQANDPAISADERDKRRQSAATKAKEINDAQIKLEQEQRRDEAQLDDEKQRMLRNLRTDIQKAVNDKVKAGGYTLVVNAANTDAFVYVSPQTDITEEVLKQLNAGAPIDLTKPASAAASNVSTNLPK